MELGSHNKDYSDFESSEITTDATIIVDLPSTSEKKQVTSSSDQGIEKGRHPQRLQKSLYTRFFGLERPETRSSVIVGSAWLSTGWLFTVRMVLFVYTFVVLVTDIFRTERPQFEFCFLTQLSYLGLTSYLGTVSWHTFSEWRRERATALRADGLGLAEEAQWEYNPPRNANTTTIERQHWLLTDMNFFLYHTICTFHVIVPLLFWGYLAYQGDAKMYASEIGPDALWRNYSFHGGDLIVVMIEIVINTMPFIPSHVVFVYVVCLLYLAEAHIVYLVNGFWTYDFLDTTHGPIWLGLYLGVGFVILCAFIFMYYLHRMKNWLRTRNSTTESQQVTIGSVQATSSIDSPTTTTPSPSDLLQIPAPVHIYRHRQISDLLTQNRKRSCSNGSESSTASTLIGFDDTKTKGHKFEHGQEP
ncbi:hypothetical protein BGX31_000671 [Mortierella sp. GBA43]|nr:hypothetical protein BGX31_000671 [Mortierella sp. GBA43]